MDRESLRVAQMWAERYRRGLKGKEESKTETNGNLLNYNTLFCCQSVINALLENIQMHVALKKKLDFFLVQNTV
jgi:hypothetical protein